MYAKFCKDINILTEILKRDDLDINATNTCNQTALHIFARCATIESFKLVLGHNDINVNLKDGSGETALHIATDDGRLEHMAALLSHKKIDVTIEDKYGLTALYNSVRSTHGADPFKEFCKHINIDINARSENGRTLLSHAILTKRTEIVKELLKIPNIDINQADNEGNRPLHYAASLELIDIIELLHNRDDIDPNTRNNDDESALHFALLANKTDTIKKLLQFKNIDVNIKNSTTGLPLMLYAIKQCAFEHLGVLLASPGIDVNATDTDGKTALHLLVDKHHIFNIKKDNMNESAYNFAKKIHDKHTSQYDHMFNALLNHSEIDVNKVDNSNQTALQRAAYCGDTNKVSLLLKHKKINVLHEDNTTPTAHKIAICEEKADIVKLIEAHLQKAESSRTNSTLLFSKRNNITEQNTKNKRHKKN